MFCEEHYFHDLTHYPYSVISTFCGWSCEQLLWSTRSKQAWQLWRRSRQQTANVTLREAKISAYSAIARALFWAMTYVRDLSGQGLTKWRHLLHHVGVEVRCKLFPPITPCKWETERPYGFIHWKMTMWVQDFAPLGTVFAPILSTWFCHVFQNPGGGLLPIYKVPRVCQHLGYVFHQKLQQKGYSLGDRVGTPAYKN